MNQVIMFQNFPRMAIISAMNDYNNLLKKAFDESKNLKSGNLAGYIPELNNVDPNLFAIAITTVEGRTYSIGDTSHLFTLQSTSKPFAYGLALNDLGEKYVHSKIGVEPTGEAFNSIIELEKNTHRPFNPMINSGAIAVSNMIKDKNINNQKVNRLERIINLFSDLASEKVTIDENVFLSEKRTAHRNRAIAHLLRHFEVIDDEIEESLDLYFKQCSINTNITGLASMAATLANHGTNPKTAKEIFEKENNRKIVSLMFSCGMYDTAGTWAFTVGIPSKSGVSGALLSVVPNKIGIACYSPLIDDHGHSIRSLNAIQIISDELNLNIFN